VRRAYEHLKDAKTVSRRLEDLEDYFYDIMGDSALILKDGLLFEDSKAGTIHIRDIVILTRRYDVEKNSIPVCNLIQETNDNHPILLM